MNKQPLTAEEQERAAYLAGDTRTAELLAQIAELEAERDQLAEELENLRDAAADDSLERWENENGPAEEYKEFFFDCFARLANHYPAPDVSSDYDKSVIFEAIERWENENGPAEEYKEFFFDCFARLAGHYPAPDVSSDYDKSVIFEAIEKGEELDANGGVA